MWLFSEQQPQSLGVPVQDAAMLELLSAHQLHCVQAARLTARHVPYIGGDCKYLRELQANDDLPNDPPHLQHGRNKFALKP